MSRLIERQHLDPKEGDASMIPQSSSHHASRECALNIGDIDVADTIMGRLHDDSAENRATVSSADALRSILDATAAIREWSTKSLDALAPNFIDSNSRSSRHEPGPAFPLM